MVMVSVVVTALCACGIGRFMPSAWLADVLGRISDHPASRYRNCCPGIGREP